jgi:hypothetical protein
MLGISLRDIDVYIASRKNIQATKSAQLEQHNAMMRAMYSGAATVFAPVFKPMTMFNHILGKQYFDTSGEEPKLMESNKSWNGHHILIPTYWFSDAKQVIAAVGRYRK